HIGNYSVNFNLYVITSIKKKKILLVFRKILIFQNDLNEHDLFWKYNKVKMAKFSSNSKPVIYNPYKERAEVFPNNFSLVLKNVQHSDSGIYKAVLSSSTDHTKVEYNVKVQVSPVNLTVIDSNSTSFLCERTVICRTVDSTITKTFVCNKETCSQVDKEHATTNSSSLDVYIQEKHIICNHSNQVSWKQERIPISSVCWAAPGTTQTCKRSIIIVKRRVNHRKINTKLQYLYYLFV
uniref:Immunoglobulin V-set domain-containing protein n=1 Tax=Oryzias latipes TaxID=8090 RepID=A0A3B3HA30_ORYLA